MPWKGEEKEEENGARETCTWSDLYLDDIFVEMMIIYLVFLLFVVRVLRVVSFSTNVNVMSYFSNCLRVNIHFIYKSHSQ